MTAMTGMGDLGLSRTFWSILEPRFVKIEQTSVQSEAPQSPAKRQP